MKTLQSVNSIPCLVTLETMNAMVRGMRKSGVVKVVWDREAGTVQGTVETKTGDSHEVFAAIGKTASGPFITRYHKDLFV